MGSKRGRSVISAIFIFFAMSCFDSISTTQVGMSDSDTFCISDHYVMQSYFTTQSSSLNELEFRSFLRLRQCSENISYEDAPPAVAMLQHRDITGEGSHRHLLTTIKLRPFQSKSQLHELVIVERLPLGVFADPFELHSLQQRRAFRDVSVFGDTDLELPSFRSNRSVVEIHVEINGNGEISVKLPLHARYQPIGESGYSRVEFGEPDLFLCSRQVPKEEHEERRCLVLSVGRSKTQTRSVVWEIPAGIRSHTEYVSVVTFVAAVLSAVSILVASVLSSKVESCKNTKQL